MNLFFAAVHVDPWGEPWLVGMRFDNGRLISEIMNENGTLWETDEAISYMDVARSIDLGMFDNSL